MDKRASKSYVVIPPTQLRECLESAGHRAKVRRNPSANIVRTEDRLTHTVAHQRGFGEVTTRLKVNLWDNEGLARFGHLLYFCRLGTKPVSFAVV